MSKLAVAGFTNLGYLLHSRHFQPNEADMTGKTVVITGATSGLGLSAARSLAQLGARVIIVGRNQEKLDLAVSGIRGQIVGERADLSLLDDIRDLAERLLEETHIDVLINNVGVLLTEREETAEGIEKTLATNLAGQFLLTTALLPRLIDSAPARIINVSSGGMYTQRIHSEDLQSQEGDYSGPTAYARTKRGQVILTQLWDDQLEGTGVTVNAMHPGWAKTGGVATSLPGFNRLMGPLLRTPEQGADTIVWLAASPDVNGQSGEFWFDRKVTPTHLVESTKEKEADRIALWDRLAALTGVNRDLTDAGD